ncbi:hypothetical protein [Bifidobacterium olomucense]|uniref:GTPase regulator-like protein n=1 Tax=Bifidobacterium olomucense TaxID=2675324 RepID=A0A7Y0F139_9BIFI|nr:hypothetical protein [Bifidobacterium sp. DSM 109959]NMM99101.1 hypothetical protein [Bifidobacterium sp. DSM 109959]
MSAEEQTTRPDKGAERPSRHAVIMRGVVTPIFGLLAVAAIALGYLNATIWKPSSEITVSAAITGTRYVVTDPGVLTLLDRSTTITVESAGSTSQAEACVALGASKDVTGWVSSEAYTRITGMSSWSDLTTKKGNSASQSSQNAAGDGNAVAFKDSDMWSSVKCGAKSVSLNSKDTADSTVAIVDLGENNTKGTVKLHWVRSEVPDFAMPFYLSGGLLAILAALSASVFAMPPHKRRKRIVEGVATMPQEEETASVSWATASGGASAASGRRGRRRHASHRRSSRPAVSDDRSLGANEQSVETSSPVIIDPASRNLVADQQSSGQSDDWSSAQDSESTSVITPDELQAYFSRLAQESTTQGSASQGNTAEASTGTFAFPSLRNEPEPHENKETEENR